MSKANFSYETDVDGKSLTIKGLDTTTPESFLKSIKQAGGFIIRVTDASELGFPANDSGSEDAKPTSEDVAEGDTAYDASLKMGMQP